MKWLLVSNFGPYDRVLADEGAHDMPSWMIPPVETQPSSNSVRKSKVPRTRRHSPADQILGGVWTKGVGGGSKRPRRTRPGVKLGHIGEQ
jgi:hypothetical protein